MEPLKRLIKLFKFFILAKDHKEEDFCWVDCINDFLIYYNDKGITTQMRPFKMMTNMNDNFFQKSKIKYN